MRISDWSSDVCSSDLSEVPAWKSQSSVASTLCQWDFCPASSRNNIAVAVPRAPSGDSTRQVSRYQPPSGWGCRSSLRISSDASLIGVSIAANRASRRSEERRVGKDVSVRVDLGGRRLIKQKKQPYIIDIKAITT